jgi:hypothetical protein
LAREPLIHVQPSAELPTSNLDVDPLTAAKRDQRGAAQLASGNPLTDTCPMHANGPRKFRLCNNMVHRTTVS